MSATIAVDGGRKHAVELMLPGGGFITVGNTLSASVYLEAGKVFARFERAGVDPADAPPPWVSDGCQRGACRHDAAREFTWEGPFFDSSRHGWMVCHEHGMRWPTGVDDDGEGRGDRDNWHRVEGYVIRSAPRRTWKPGDPPL